MPKLSTATPKYRKKTIAGICYAVVTICGRDIYLGRYNTQASRIEYDRQISEWLANGRQLPVDDQAEVTINELCVRYFKRCEGYYVKNGCQTNEVAVIKNALQHIQTTYGQLTASEFGPKKLKAIREQMIRNDLSRRVINKQVQRIKAMFRWAVEEELMPGTGIFIAAKTAAIK